MAHSGVQLDRETFSCSICLDLLKDPVALACGHSFCMVCIKSYWDGEAEEKVLSCPHCRQAFQQRPVLQKNTMLAVVVEELKKTGLQAAAVDDQFAADEDVACDFCPGRKLRASKSCLTCLVSFCEKHLQPHYDVAPLKKHKLVDPCKKIQEVVCSLHDEVMKIFCRTDKQCICSLCSLDEHKGHKIVSAAAERGEREKELEETRGTINQKIQDRGNKLKQLQLEIAAINVSADQTVENSQKIFAELIHLFQKRSSDVEQKIKSQQESEVSRVKELQEKLEQEISELRRHDAELEKVSHIDDHTKFLQNYPTMPQFKQLNDYVIRPLRYFEDVTVALSKVRDKVQDVVSETDILQLVLEVDVLLTQPEPKTRAGCLKCACELTLEQNGANKYKLFSDEDRKMTITPQTKMVRRYSQDTGIFYEEKQKIANNFQALSSQSLTGRCYWEVQWEGARCAIAVTNSRTVDGREFGRDEKSWAIFCDQTSYSIRHDKNEKLLNSQNCPKVGVYLDHKAGILSFYRVSETRHTLLHRFQTTFTQPLYAGLYIENKPGKYASVEICKIK